MGHTGTGPTGSSNGTPLSGDIWSNLEEIRIANPYGTEEERRQARKAIDERMGNQLRELILVSPITDQRMWILGPIKATDEGNTFKVSGLNETWKVTVKMEQIPE